MFHDETVFIRDPLDRQFGTRGRSLVLLNNHRSMSDQPLATTSSLKVALNGHAAKMDTDEDILFLYLTSHRSRKFVLSIDRPGLALPDLSAEELAAQLRAIPVKWKVVVMSACYSGGFLPLLSAPETLVMTVASSTRTSFGCSDTSDMTYFGKAYFKESLPQATSFFDAFHKATELVEVWERVEVSKNEGAKHSEPQIPLGQLIEAQLEWWWKQPGAVSR
ncbi:MAG: hypothetical protein FJ194_05260 [Gammaproteobacteria bacterium]|nr:hypothetical protein [Gammaproteobacteria bacterium]